MHRDPARASTPLGQIPPLGPQHQHNRPRHIEVTQLALRRRIEGDLVAIQVVERCARGRPREDRAHEARTAFGEYGSAQPGPRTPWPSASACAERMIVPTLPGSSTPCRYTSRSPPRLGPPLLVDADHAGARAERARPRRAAPAPRPRRRGGRTRGVRRLRGLDQVLALRAEQPELRPPALLLELADRLELVVVG